MHEMQRWLSKLIIVCSHFIIQSDATSVIPDVLFRCRSPHPSGFLLNHKLFSREGFLRRGSAHPERTVPERRWDNNGVGTVQWRASSSRRCCLPIVVNSSRKDLEPCARTRASDVVDVIASHLSPTTDIGTEKCHDDDHRAFCSEPSDAAGVDVDRSSAANGCERTGNSLPLSFVGKHKWLGGAVDDTDGCIYGVPSHSSDVLCLFPSSSTTTSSSNSLRRCNDGDADGFGIITEEYRVRTIPLPSFVPRGKFKWLRGIIHDGYLYGIPAWAQCGVLRVDIDSLWGRRRRQRQRQRRSRSEEERDVEEEKEDDGVVKIIPLPAGVVTDATREGRCEEGGDDEDEENDDLPSRWLWHGAALNKNKTAIYCIPSNARSVLKIDLASARTSLLPIPDLLPNATDLSDTNKWYGGILGDDDAIYGIPYAASGVLRIDAKSDGVSVLGNFGSRRYNWHGGIKSPKTGAIYAFPAHSSSVLKIRTRTEVGTVVDDDDKDKIEEEGILSQIPIQRAPYDHDCVSRYKWLGGSLGADGNIYGMPSDASSVLRIDVESDEARTFGVAGGEKNKWQGGVLGRDGFVYAIPSNAKHVLRIDTRPEQWTKDDGDDDNDNEDEGERRDRAKVTLVGEFPPKKDKWQGGFVAKDGRIYGIPENFDRVLKLTPHILGLSPKDDREDNGVSVEYL